MPDGKVLPEAFRFPDLSVVRSMGPEESKFLPSDALWVSEEFADADGRVYFPESAVVQIRVADVPGSISRDSGKPYDLKVVHVPYDDHYPHSEVQVFKDGSHITDSESKIKARHQIRQAFADASTRADTSAG